MARPLRIEFAGAVNHITSRGNARQSIFLDQSDGDGIRIEFSMKDPKAPELVYEDKQGAHKFSGQSIHLEKLELGLMASVVLEPAPDLRRITFSLAVPSANRIDNQRSISVKTFAVRTTARTSIGGSTIS
jgi:hypothetical protein